MTTGEGVSAGDAIARELQRRGVRSVYGFPGGGSNLDLIASLTRAGIDFVLTRTEGGAAFMAAAGAELTGVPGVVVVGSGPGLTSVVNGVAHAHLDRVPLLVISDRYTDAERAATDHQVLDHRALLAPVVKSSATVDAGSAAAATAAALARALTHPRGPVHLDVPRDVAAAPARDEIVTPPAGRATRTTGSPAEIVAALRGAERPVILVGLECNHAVDSANLLRLAEHAGAAVLTTYKAKGMFSEDHPLWGGIVTGATLEGALLEGSDAIVALGLDPVELLTRPWPYPAPRLQVRACDLGIAHLGAEEAWVGDLGADVRRLAAAAGPSARPRTVDPGLDRLRLRPASGMATWEAIEAVAAEAPHHAVVAVDAGAHMFAATSFWRCRAPRRFLISNGLASMGFAVPAAIAAARERPDAPAIAITGDGGMAYHGFELETAVRCGARVVVVVIDDASLSLIRIKHEAKGHPRRQLDFGPVGFAGFAAALGVAGATVETPAELRAATRAAIASPRSTVIDVRLSGDEHRATLDAIRG